MRARLAKGKANQPLAQSTPCSSCPEFGSTHTNAWAKTKNTNGGGKATKGTRLKSKSKKQSLCTSLCHPFALGKKRKKKGLW
jgi:hypothetical protein